MSKLGKKIKNIFEAPEMPKAPKVQEVEEPAAMPVPDDAAIERARRRAYASTRRRSGRQSTILSDSDTLG